MGRVPSSLNVESHTSLALSLQVFSEGKNKTLMPVCEFLLFQNTVLFFLLFLKKKKKKKSKCLFFHSFGDQKSEIKVLAVGCI